MAAFACAQAVLDPPYGLRWGDSPEKLVEWAGRHAMDVTISLPGARPDLRILRISPQSGFLPETNASAVEGHFLSGRLFEVTVHYDDPAATVETILARFEELRKQIGIRHGSLIANRQKRTVEDQFATRTRSYHREPVKGLFLLLALTEVEDLLRQSKEVRFSLIYRNDNLRKEIVTDTNHQPADP